MAASIENMTLREKLSDAERLTRELIHHLEHGFIPKAHLLRRTARRGADPTEGDEITDMSIRSGVDGVLDSDDFTQRLTSALRHLLTSIDRDMSQLLGD